MATINDHGAGSLQCVQNVVRRPGVDMVIGDDPERTRLADGAILPAAGSFGMKRLTVSGLTGLMNGRVLGGETPRLGICLGSSWSLKAVKRERRRVLG